LKSRLAILQKETEEASKGREESVERTKKLEELAKLREENAKLKAELQQYAENDPELIEAYSTLSKNVHSLLLLLSNMNIILFCSVFLFRIRRKNCN
jgi:hypothetical protein